MPNSTQVSAGYAVNPARPRGPRVPRRRPQATAEEKPMKLRHKLADWLNKGRYDKEANVPLAVAPGRDGIDLDNGLRFTVQPATGGVIVQIYHYDRKTDRSNNIMHVIPDGDDIAESIAHIVSMELLRA